MGVNILKVNKLLISFVLLLAGAMTLIGCQTAEVPEEQPAQEENTQTPSAPAAGPNFSYIQMIDEKTGWAGTSEGIVKTTDGCQTWTGAGPEVNFNLPEVDTGAGTKYGVPEVSFLDQKQGWMMLHYDAAMGSEAVWIFKTIDGGQTWEQVANSDPSEEGAGNTPGSLPLAGIKTGVAFADPETGCLTGTYYGDGIYFYQTEDGGATWNWKDLAIPEGYAAEGGSATSYPPAFHEGRTGVLPVIFHGDKPAIVLYLTTDGGGNWAPEVLDGVDTDVASFSWVNFISADAGWTIIAGNLWKTMDGGQSWNQITTQ